MWPKTAIIHTWQLCALNAPKVCYIKSKSISNEQMKERESEKGKVGDRQEWKPADSAAFSVMTGCELQLKMHMKINMGER